MLKLFLMPIIFVQHIVKNTIINIILILVPSCYICKILFSRTKILPILQLIYNYIHTTVEQHCLHDCYADHDSVILVPKIILVSVLVCFFINHFSFKF